MSKDLVKGVITRIAVKNFVTYDEVVVKPGKNLNLIIGPNGTGKSTIVAAIVLGLGGHPRIIGRADTISSYIKYGQTKATISIDIQHEANKFITIERTFDTDNHTTWTVNKKPTTNRDILLLMKKFNIQVDNLCQFLPQDKVQEFSKLSNHDLLSETERSVGDPKLIEYHNKLKELRSKQAEIEKDLSKNSTLQAKFKQEYDSLKDKVGHINEQKQIKKKLQQLKQKKAWMQYQMMKEDFDKAKKGKDEAEKKTKKLQKKLEPVLNEIAKLKNSISTLEKTAKQHNTETVARSSKLNKFLDEIENYEKSVNDFETQCEQKVEEEQECDTRVNQMKQQINKMENDLKSIIDSAGSETQLDSQINEITSKMNEYKRHVSDLQMQQQYIKDDSERIGRKIRDEQQRLKEMVDVEQKRLYMLQSLSRDAYEGVIWLRSNKHLFSHEIHEPIILHINLKDKKYSQYFENIINNRDLTAFVCEDKSDMNLLLKHLRDQQRLRVNAVHSDPNKIINYQPDIPLERIVQYGFEHYLISLIEVPKTILNYLVTTYALNQIPIGNDKVANYIDQIPLRCFFSNSHRFNVNKSKYTGERSISQVAIYSREILAITIDQEKINNIQQEIENFTVKKNELQNKLGSYAESFEALNTKIDSQKEIKNKLQRSKESMKSLKAKINVNNRKIHEAESNRKSVEEIRSHYKAEIEAAIGKQLKQYEKYDRLLDECYKSLINSEEMKLQIKLKKNQLASKESDSQDLREELSNSERDLKALIAEIAPLKEDLKKYYDYAVEATGGYSYKDKEFEQFKTIFAKLPPTLEDISEQINSNNAKIFCSNDQQDSEKILDRFKHSKREFEKFTNLLADKEEELGKVTQEINTVKNLWLPMLESLVEKINSNFSNYFTKMKCAGEVSLNIPDNQNDFDKYGLKIRVKFRDADELQELTRNHQSGGERAVTTAVYMIALQELTIVPFRCVDEINQGMDATNERRVFELIVNITSQSNSSQYFMLTPKLLPDLKYNDSITVLTVFNGRFMLPCSEFDFHSQCDDIVKAVVKRRNTTMMAV